MDSVVPELCYDGWWETLEDGHMEYVNGKNRALFVGKNCLFDQFLARVYEVLQINPNEYSITMKTTLRSSNTLYRICALPMDIFDDEIVRVAYDIQCSQFWMHSYIRDHITSSSERRY